MNEQATCPECGKPLPPGSPHGLCPACLMAQGMASRTFDSLGGDVPPSVPPPSPEEIADKFPQFEVVECLGRGGMGVVYKARQKSLDRWVAIKVLAPERVREERFAAHFEREAKTLGKMSHSNIVTVFDHGETGGLFYIVMEYVDGVNLRDLLKDGKMAPEQALAIVPPICEALEYAHDKGVIHRDIKPENILLDRDGRVKIADFGIASLVGASGEKSGTPPYMAPEQEKGVVDRRGDIYALGAVLYEMLTGERPTRDLVAPSKRVEVDVKIDEMVLRALEKEPERRYQTAGEFRTMVQTITTPPQTASTPASGSPSNTNAKTRNTGWKVLKVFSWIGIVAGIVGILALIFSVMVVPRWEAGWADEGRQLPLFHILIINISHFCKHLWPVLVFLLSILGISSVVGLVVALKQLSRPAAPASKGGFFRRWWWLGLIMLILSPFLGLAVGYGLSHYKQERTEAMARILLPADNQGRVLVIPEILERLSSEQTLLRVAEKLDLPHRWKLDPAETARRIQRMIDLEHLSNTMLLEIRVRNYGYKVPDDTRQASQICKELVREAVVSMPEAQVIVGVVEAEVQHRVRRDLIMLLIVCGLLGVLISPVLALLSMWFAHSFSAGKGDEGTSLVFSNLALGLAFLSGLIPTLFYWLRPLHGDWLTDSTVELMLWVTLGVAILALLSGWFTRRIARGRTAMIIGGISLTIWLLMFVAGELSSAKKQDYSEEIASHAPVEFLGQSNDLGRIRQSWRIEPKRPMIVTCGWYALEGERVVAHQAMGNALEPGTAPIELALEYVMDAGQLKLAVGSGGAVWRGTRAAPGSGFRSRPSRDPEPLTADRYTELWKGECFETEPDGSGERILRTYVFAARLIGPEEDPVQTPFEDDVRSGRFGEEPITGNEGEENEQGVVDKVKGLKVIIPPKVSKNAPSRWAQYETMIRGVTWELLIKTIASDGSEDEVSWKALTAHRGEGRQVEVCFPHGGKTLVMDLEVDEVSQQATPTRLRMEGEPGLEYTDPAEIFQYFCLRYGEEVLHLSLAPSNEEYPEWARQGRNIRTLRSYARALRSHHEEHDRWPSSFQILSEDGTNELQMLENPLTGDRQPPIYLGGPGSEMDQPDPSRWFLMAVPWVDEEGKRMVVSLDGHMKMIPEVEFQDRLDGQWHELADSEGLKWTGTYHGLFNDQEEVWEIVRRGSDYHWLESPGGETGDFNRLKEKDGALWAEDAAERFRFSRMPNGIRFEMWQKQTGEKVVDAVLERAELDENNWPSEESKSGKALIRVSFRPMKDGPRGSIECILDGDRIDYEILQERLKETVRKFPRRDMKVVLGPGLAHEQIKEVMDIVRHAGALRDVRDVESGIVRTSFQLLGSEFPSSARQEVGVATLVEESLRVEIRKQEGTSVGYDCLIDGERIDYENLHEKLQEKLLRKPESKVEIACEPNVPLTEVIELIDFLGSVGVEDSRFRILEAEEPSMLQSDEGEIMSNSPNGLVNAVPVLEFHIAPETADLESSELASCRGWLKAGKIGFWWRDARTTGIAGRMPNHVWLPAPEGLEIPVNLVTGEYEGQRYLLVSDKPTEKMVSGDGDAEWGLAKVEAAKQEGDVLIRFDEKGGKKFKALTEANMYCALAVVLDDEVASVPVIRNVMEREVVLGGTRDKKKAADLAERLMRLVKPAGSLELRLEKARAEKLGFTIEALQARILGSGIIPQTVKVSIAVEPDGLTIMIPNSSDVDIMALTNASLHNDEGKEVKVGDLFHIILKKENDDNP